MRYFFILLLFSYYSLFALSIIVNHGREDKKDYISLHIKDHESFLCEIENDVFKKIKAYHCTFKNLPSLEFKEIENEFFKIIPNTKGENLIATIYPKQKVKFYSINDDFKEDTTVYNRLDKRSKHWLWLGYKKDIPYFSKSYNKTKKDVLNFPVHFNTYKKPTIGALDFKDEPLLSKDIKDVTRYLHIKKLFKQKKYDTTLNKIEELFELYPQTIFRNDLLSFRIQSKYALKMYENLFNDGKEFIKKYPTNPDIPEIMLELAHSYQKVGLFKDMEYFFDRLLEEHKGTPQSIRADIFIGDSYAGIGRMEEALEYYEKALANATELKTAALASNRLAEYYQSKGALKKTKMYYQKIISTYPEYFQGEIDIKFALAEELAQAGFPLIAAGIADILRKPLGKLSKDKEKLLYYAGIWRQEGEEIEKAYEIYQTYLARYKLGTYTDNVIDRLDILFFDMKDSNKSKMIVKYDELIKKYQDKSTAKKALYEKFKLLATMRNYDEVLALEDKVQKLDHNIYKDIDKIIYEGALFITREYLQDQNCTLSFKMIKQYDLNLSKDFDYDLYTCYYKYGKYNKALAITKNYIHSDDLEEKADWINKTIDNLIRLDRHQEIIDAIDDILALGKALKTNKYDKLYYTKFKCLKNLEDEDGIMELVNVVSQKFPTSYQNIEPYVSMLKIARRTKDDVMIENFANKIIKLQERTKSYTQTPFVEFTYVSSLKALKKHTKAIKILKVLIKRELKPSEYARAYYLLGALYQKTEQKNKAKQAYEKSAKSDPKSSWGNIAKDTLELL